ncbi:maleylpyruvate isomerase family mycothiol-dependent enzyme [Actinokineospora diospyrosa]|uniref:TIGR03083 family protein n=1 Tax=Actinokineospora diospyrosa TaxID=103728 RepID=A0ABT1IPK2_9PSEU|nr:maleylpyruvate isomerase family mycothiol-dependent enzyme [Actinokineospora diospyrosa]MCP2274386.1 TIGR03083 family protein [Actinokineospora diospyrosa]
MHIDQLADALREQTAAFADAADAEAGTPVPSCPGWVLRNLVGHIGQAHRWSAGIAGTGQPSPLPDPLTADPGERDAWAGWLREGAEELIAAVGDGTRVVWTFFGERPSRFWLRRMLADTTIHRADAAIATGRAHGVPATLATEVITEGLELLTSPAAPQVRAALAGLRGTGETILLRSTDGPGWLITRAPTGPTFTTTDGTAADVTATASAQDLLWLFSRRVPPTDPRITVTGDAAGLDDWLALTVF